MKFGIAGAAVLASVSLTLGACGDDPTSPEPDPGGASQLLPTLGMTAVTERFTAEVAVRGDHAYTSTWGSRPPGVVGNAVKVWNVAGPKPQLVDSLIVAGATTTGDVQISDDGQLLVVATESNTAPGSIAIYDRANPAKPALVAQYTSANTATGVHTVKLGRVGGRLYAFLSVDPPAPRLVALDLTNPAAPTEALVMPVGSGGPGEHVHDVHVRDGILFAAAWDLGVVIFDIGGGGRGGTVSSPVRLGSVLTVGGNVHNIAWFHDPRSGSKRYALVGEELVGSIPTSSAGDIHVLDVSDLAAPREVAFFRVAGAGTHNFSLDEASGVLYAAYYNGGVRALDIRGDLGACTDAQRAPDGRCDLAKMGRELAHGPDASPVYVWGVQYQNNAVYASDMWNGIWKLDASALQR